MTAQHAEILVYRGEQLRMCSEPLSEHVKAMQPGLHFKMPFTSLERGYIGRWEIMDDRLYLIGLDGKLSDGTKASVETFFPDAPGPVFADWYSGQLRVTQGKRLGYIHFGFESIFERDLLLDIEHGVLVRSHVRDNTQSPLPAHAWPPMQD